jgi:nitroimidazol reductase NimA-like FMN-containing flavoprotein (pyridoxamine 5'-phosphate oxidase superfamily)
MPATKEQMMMTDTRFDRNGLEILEYDECLRLLSTVKIGRVAVVTDAMPVVLPVTFVLDGDRVVFCSTPGTKLYVALDGAIAAFEADEVDPDLRYGWSVSLVGPAHVLTDDADIERVRVRGLRPWAKLESPTHIAIDAQVVTGRRVRRQP